MKTSLLIEDKVFTDAKREAAETGRTVGEVISQWVHTGHDAWLKRKKKKVAKVFKPVNLGEHLIDF